MRPRRLVSSLSKWPRLTPTLVRAASRSAQAGVYDLSFGTFTIHLTITATPRDVGGPFIAFSSNDPGGLVTSIYVKGGNTANLYTYPGAGIQSDSLLHAPVNPNGNQGETG